PPLPQLVKSLRVSRLRRLFGELDVTVQAGVLGLRDPLSMRRFMADLEREGTPYGADPIDRQIGDHMRVVAFDHLASPCDVERDRIDALGAVDGARDVELGIVVMALTRMAGPVVKGRAMRVVPL